MKNPIKEFNKIQKNNTEKRCANQRSELFSLNNKVLQQKYEIEQQQAEINRLREALKEISRNKTTEEQQGNPDYVDEDGDLIGDFEYAYDEFIKIARKALNGESE